MLPSAAMSAETPRELRRRILYEGSVGRFGVHDVSFPGGHETELVLLAHPGASAIVAFTSERDVLLVRQFRFAVGGYIWEIPAGKRDAGEDPSVCAARELREETGYRAGRLVRTGQIITAPGFTDEIIHLFCAYDLEPGEACPEPNELIELHEVPLERALAMVESGELYDAKSVAGLHHAQRLHR